MSTSVLKEGTKGELFERYNYNTARTWLQKQARKIYYNSTRPMCCFFCGYEKHLDLAHRKAVADFPADTLCTEINHIDNLVMLCPTHHREADGGQINLESALPLIGLFRWGFVPMEIDTPRMRNFARTKPTTRRRQTKQGSLVFKPRIKGSVGSWYFCYRFQGKPWTFKIGSFEQLPTKEAAQAIIDCLKKTVPLRFDT